MSLHNWPGYKYPVPYSADELYERLRRYLAKHPKAKFDALHNHLTGTFGVCVRSHAKAMLVLYRDNQGDQ